MRRDEVNRGADTSDRNSDERKINSRARQIRRIVRCQAPERNSCEKREGRAYGPSMITNESHLPRSVIRVWKRRPKRTSPCRASRPQPRAEAELREPRRCLLQAEDLDRAWVRAR